MAFRRYATAILLFVIVVAAGFTMYQVADAGENDAAFDRVNVTNESISQQTNLWQYVNVALDDTTAGFDADVTVYNSTGAELTEDTDYEWNATDGTIFYFNTASVTDGNTGNITYTYHQNTPDVNALSAVIDPIVAMYGRAGLLFGGIGLAVVLLAFAAMVARYFSGNDFQSNR